MPVATRWSELVERHSRHPGRGGCGVGAVVDLSGEPSHELVERCLHGLCGMEHRGGALEDTGDGAGLLLSIDRAFFLRSLATGKRLPEGHALVVGVLFFPLGEEANLPHAQHEVDATLRRHGLAPLGWRHVPVEPSVLGDGSRESRRDVWQLFAGEGMVPREDLPLTLHRVKSAIEDKVRECYVASLSPETVVYKALATGPQLAAFYPDLRDPALRASYAIFHRRYSTNTFSNWYLAQVFRLLGHNGEINTIKANRNAVANLEAELKLSHVLMPQGSDSADMDRVVDLFVSRGVPLPETIARLVPAAWRELARPRPEVARWYQGVQRALRSLGAWEGPAAIVATDGRHVLGALDRMGLRPLRWVVTRSGRLILGSEVGAIPVDFADVAEVGQLDPGEMVCVDLAAKRLLRPQEAIEEIVAKSKMNVAELSEDKLVTLSRRPEERVPPSGPGDHLALNAFGWSRERAKHARHMAEHGKEPITSMGNDRPLPVFSALRPPLAKYFKQIVAVVTNPPIDPIRESGAFDLSVTLGASPTAHESSFVYEPQPGWRLPSPVVTEEQLWLVCENRREDKPRAKVFDATFTDPCAGASTGAKAIARKIAELCREAVACLKSGGASVLVFSDRVIAESPDPARLPLPMVLLASAVHNALVEEGERRHASVVIDTGEVQEGHDVAVLIANGATAVCPWLFYRVGSGSGPVTRMVAALEECLQRVMSKMGICSADGYRGSRLFEAVGLAPAVVEHWLPGVTSRLGGIELEDVYDDLRARRAKGAEPPRESDVSVYRKAVWSELQTTARGHDPGSWGRFLTLVEDTPPVYLRDLLQPRTSGTAPVPLEEVASEDEIVAACFRGAAMSHGALHRVAHRAIAGAFNALGAMSNCGEGGEDPRRDAGGPWAPSRSRIRQVASGRFGVEARYLVHADEIQVKIGQGAKPGEGGHLPAAKVTPEVAAIRRTQAGVTLISPPPHHDIYSIEDLAELIFDLRQVNPSAKVSVKIPAVTDIGTIAVGIAKAGADVIDLSGMEGGTGAAAASSIEHAGLPLERALSEVHQALLLNGVRGRVRLRADGGLKTGWDVAAVLAIGADEVSLGTALMIAEQCVFCHGCAAGLCPAGITTQSELVARRLMTERKERPNDESLPDEEEARYEDAKNAVERYLRALAGDLRRRLAAFGLRHPSQLVGRVDLLERKPPAAIPGDPFVVERAAKVDLSELLLAPDAPVRVRSPRLPVDPTSTLNGRLAEDAAAGRPLRYRVASTDRAVGATLAGRIAGGRIRVPDGGFAIELEGWAGQALGFACVDGMRIALTGFGNDKVAEAMSGGEVVVRLPREIPADARGGFSAVGNAAAYGATGGRLFVEGRAGQRAGVRNSGASIVVEGAGKYAFEYMTGGIGVVLGPAGTVVASGMTGGVVYLLRGGPVAAEEVVHRDARVTPLEEADVRALRALIAAHADATGSARAESLRALDGPALAARFAKIVPA